MDSSPPPQPHPWQARALSVVFAAAGIYLFVLILTNIRHHPLIAGFSELTTSPWSAVLILDYVVSTIFSALYIYLRNGPSVVCLPPALIAVSIPFLGNTVLAWYIAMLMYSTGSVYAALFPESANFFQPLASVPMFNRTNARRTTCFIALLFTTLIVALVAMMGWAANQQSFLTYYRQFRNLGWIVVIFQDDFVGGFFAAVYVFKREGGLSWRVILFILGLFCFGNIATCIYVLIMARQAYLIDEDFRKIALSESCAF